MVSHISPPNSSSCTKLKHHAAKTRQISPGFSPPSMRRVVNGWLSLLLSSILGMSGWLNSCKLPHFTKHPYKAQGSDTAIGQRAGTGTSQRAQRTLVKYHFVYAYV